MLSTQSSHGLEYMQEVGVPADDVAWLATQLAAGRPLNPEANTRARRIEDLAYDGLIATIRRPTARLQ